MYQISQDNIFLEKAGISPNCGFFWTFLALFDTFTSRDIHSYIKLELFD